MNVLQEKINVDDFEGFIDALSTVPDQIATAALMCIMLTYDAPVHDRYIRALLRHPGTKVVAFALAKTVGGPKNLDPDVFDMALSKTEFKTDDDVDGLFWTAARASRYHEVREILRVRIDRCGISASMVGSYVALKNGRVDPKKHLQPMQDLGIDFARFPDVLPGAMRVPGMGRELVKLGIPKSAAYNVSMRYLNSPWYRDAITREF